MSAALVPARMEALAQYVDVSRVSKLENESTFSCYRTSSMATCATALLDGKVPTVTRKLMSAALVPARMEALA